jgi:hypothetical protein
MRLKRFDRFVKSKITQTWAEERGLDYELVEEVMEEIRENPVAWKIFAEPIIPHAVSIIGDEMEVEVRRRMIIKNRNQTIDALLFGD